jgi:division protein CdvB (Snf7/Vps24/ESCRT-III family)
MTSSESATNTSQTLDQRLAEGAIPAAQALSYAVTLGEALRRMHDAGQVHGAVSPANITVSGMRLELPPAAAPAGGATPYTAPELLQGHPADARSDIFSFGAVAYEMLTGHPAFQGDDPTALAEAISHAVPPSSGNPGIDLFLPTCLAKDPAARFESMQKALLELKLLALHARRAQVPARGGQAAAALRSQLQQIETRLASRLEAYEKTASDAGRAASEALDVLREQLSALGAQFAAAQERAEQGTANVEQMIEAIGSRVAQAEQGLDALGQAFATHAEDAVADLHNLRESLKAHGAAIELARRAQTQTDNLVEGVVEALDLLQLSIMEQTEEHF